MWTQDLVEFFRGLLQALFRAEYAHIHAVGTRYCRIRIDSLGQWLQTAMTMRVDREHRWVKRGRRSLFHVDQIAYTSRTKCKQQITVYLWCSLW